MILLCGLRSDPCLTAVERSLSGRPVAWFDQEEWAKTRVTSTVTSSGLSGTVRLDDRAIDIHDVTGIYLRLIDFRKLRSLRNVSPTSATWRQCQAVHEAVRALAEASSARLVSPLRADGTNFSKPFQTLALSRAGLQVPDTLITNDPIEVAQFLKQHREVIYKSTSAVRSIVQVLDAASERELRKIRTCPVQFQVRLRGRDVRVHVVGSQLFATAIDSPTVDYRYASIEGGVSTLTPIALDPETASQVRSSCLALGLAVAGVDLKVDGDGSAWFLEVNPNPGFSWFESATAQPIAAAIADYLGGS